MANSIVGINDDIISQGVLEGFVAAITPLTSFSTNFNADAAKKGDKVSIVRTLAADAATTKASHTAYTMQDVDNDAIELTLGQPVYVSASLDDVEVSQSSVLNLELYGKQKGFQLAKKILQDIWSKITAANFGAAAHTGAASTLDGDAIAAISTICDTALMPEDMRSLVLKETYFGNLLKDDTLRGANYFGSTDMIRDGKIPSLFGFNIFKSTLIPANGENLVGFAAHASAIAVAMRYLMPQEGHKYNRAEAITDPLTGITIGLRDWYDENTGERKRVWECVYGYEVGIAAGIKRIVSA